MIGVYLASQSAPESTIKKKTSLQTLAYLVNVSAMFDNHKILLFWLSNKQTFRSCFVHVISTYYVRKGS